MCIHIPHSTRTPCHEAPDDFFYSNRTHRPLFNYSENSHFIIHLFRRFLPNQNVIRGAENAAQCIIIYSEKNGG